jgi:DNA-binding CsgD family transcriptional regulator
MLNEMDVLTAEPEAAPRPPSRGLSRRELEVLALIADGCSTREIARTLWVTEETVKTHVRRMLVRLDARTRAQAVAIAFREGLWDADEEGGRE